MRGPGPTLFCLWLFFGTCPVDPLFHVPVFGVGGDSFSALGGAFGLLEASAPVFVVPVRLSGECLWSFLNPWFLPALSAKSETPFPATGGFFQTSTTASFRGLGSALR